MKDLNHINLYIDAYGRLVIPKPLRTSLGFSNKRKIIAYIDEGRLVLDSRAALLTRVQERYKGLEEEDGVE